MKETGILMTPENIQATIEGRKSMTRRVIKPQPPDDCGHIRVELFHPTKVNRKGEEYPGDEIFGAYSDDGEWGCKCPYGQAGDFFYLKEAHYRFGYWVALEEFTKTGLRKMCFITNSRDTAFRYINNPPGNIKHRRYGGIGWYKRSPLFMPKKYARHWYEITGIRAERLQDISIKDCLAEGVEYMPNGKPREQLLSASHIVFADYWDSINAARGYSWESNPWVWPISYKAVLHGQR